MARPALRRAILLAILLFSIAAVVFLPKLAERLRWRSQWPGGFGPAVAGSFYPSDRVELGAALDDLLASAEAKPYPGRLVGLLVPHAAIRYAGPVQAAAYRLVEGRRYDEAIVLGPAHFEKISGAAATLDATHYRTPLGGTRLSGDTFQGFSDALGLIYPDSWAYRKEHSVEMAVPWLQRALTDFALTPLLLGEPTDSESEALADALAERVGRRRTLIVASTDLSHDRPDAEARGLDARTLALIRAGDPRALAEAVRAGEAELCGLEAAEALMGVAARLGRPVWTPLAYGTSAEEDGETDRVVGYGALALSDASLPEYEPDGAFAREVREQLVRVARAAVEAGRFGGPTAARADLDPVFEELHGAFVSVYCGGELRGCIGKFRSDLPLFDAVAAVAPMAAADSRFAPVTAEEWPGCRVEVHVLGPLEPMEDPSKLRLGRDGLLVRRLTLVGVLLPEVPIEQGWDREAFIDKVCEKAGIPPGVCRQKGNFSRFLAPKVMEPEPGGALPEGAK